MTESSVHTENKTKRDGKGDKKEKPRARTIIVKPDENATCPTCGTGNELREDMFENYDVQKSYFTVKYMTDYTVPYKCYECNKYWANSEDMDSPLFANKEVERVTPKIEMTVCSSAKDPDAPCCRAYHTRCYLNLLSNNKIKSKGRKRR